MIRNLTLASSLLIVWSSWGQTIYNDALISIRGALMIVPDSMVNNGTIINAGTLVLSGSWTNTGTYVAESGEVAMTGANRQYIDHRGQAFTNLSIGGGSNKLLVSGLEVLGKLNFTDGYLVARPGAKVSVPAGVEVLGASDQGHVIGPFECSGTGDWLFPVGNGSTYLPVRIIGDKDAGARAVVEVMDGNIQLQANPPLGSISTLRYWTLSESSGSLENSKILLSIRDETSLTHNSDELVVSWAASLSGAFVNFGRAAFDGDLMAGGITSADSPRNGFYAVATLLEEPHIEVFNALSINGDSQNEYLRILAIERFPNNTVTVFNRWGDKVFEIHGYNNQDQVFKGESNVAANRTLPSATYFYRINPGNGDPLITGYLVIRR